MYTVHGRFNGRYVELEENAPLEGEGSVLVTFLEGGLETSAARERRLGHFGDTLRPPHVYGEELKRQMIKQYRRFTVGAVMTRDVQTILPSASVSGALQVMRQKGITSILVEPTGQSSWGIMTMRDVLKHIVASSRSPEDVSVGDIASKQLVTLPPDATLRECAQLMVDRGVRRIIVVENDKPSGIISDTDIFQVVEERGWGNEQ